MTDKAMDEHDGLLAWRALALQERERANETSVTANRVIAMLEEKIRHLESCREAEIAQARYERAEARVAELQKELGELQARLDTAERLLRAEYDRMGKAAAYIDVLGLDAGRRSGQDADDAAADAQFGGEPV